jgi:hypothetical protein
MSKFSIEAKQAIIEKVLSKDGRTLREIAESYNPDSAPDFTNKHPSSGLLNSSR